MTFTQFGCLLLVGWIIGDLFDYAIDKIIGKDLDDENPITYDK